MERIQVMDTPTTGEVIAVFRNDDGSLRNVTIRNAAALQSRVRGTPQHLPNPAYTAVTNDVFSAAEAQVEQEARLAAAAKAEANNA